MEPQQTGHTGIVFDLKEMALFDGPGIRTTVFLKGCPLRCQWCHNPEGLSAQQELMVSPNGCRNCGRCIDRCPHPNACMLCGACVSVCPERLRRVCGTRYNVQELVLLLRKNEPYLYAHNGGVTFSGGEPTLQGAFLLAVLQELEGMHRAIETCGMCDCALFSQLIHHVELVILDIKLVDAAKHQYYTGVDNGIILRNLAQLKASGKPFWVRIPLIPGVNDSAENMEATASLLEDAVGLQRVELLPYHKTAGAKYTMVGRNYRPDFDPQQPPLVDTTSFVRRGIVCV